ncbi:hypothetical protein HK099_002021, partial [Clydaea vesicula]
MEKQLVITNKKNNKGNNNNTTNNIVITTNSISNSSIEELITQKINSLNFSENDKNGKIKIEIKLEQKDINKILNQSLINNNQLNNVSQPTHSHSINHSSFPNNDHVQKQLDDLHKKTKQINEKQLLLGLKQRELNKLEADQLIEQQNLHNDLERENLEIAKLLKLEQENLNSVLNNQNNCYNYNIEFISTKYLNNFENFKRLQFKTEFLDLNLNLKIKQYDILEFDKNKVENQKLKLEALCREFQNKSILLKDELDNLYKTEKEKRDLLEKNFEISLNELNLIMEKKSNEKKNLDLENETLKNKLSNLTKQYELRELHFQSVLKSKDLELQLQRVRLEKDLSSHKLELRNLLKKFKFAEQTLVKSNDIFTEFQKERNGINDLKTALNLEVEKNKKLRNLCKALQEERKELMMKLKKSKEEIPPEKISNSCTSPSHAKNNVDSINEEDNFNLKKSNFIKIIKEENLKLETENKKFNLKFDELHKNFDEICQETKKTKELLNTEKQKNFKLNKLYQLNKKEYLELKKQETFVKLKLNQYKENFDDNNNNILLKKNNNNFFEINKLEESVNNQLEETLENLDYDYDGEDDIPLDAEASFTSNEEEAFFTDEDNLPDDN